MDETFISTMTKLQHCVINPLIFRRLKLLMSTAFIHLLEEGDDSGYMHQIVAIT